MKVAQIKDIEALADGTTIGEMRVKVKKVFPPRTGTSKHGEWRVQNCILEDSTGEIRAAFWIKDDMTDLEGQTCTLKSRAGKKGLSGVHVQYSNHSSANELKITENAAILDNATQKLNELNRPNHGTAPAAAPVANVAGAKQVLFQTAQLMVEAVKAAQWVGTQVTLTPEQLQAVASSLFISGDRAGLAKAFPTSLTKEEPKQEESQPEEEDDDIGF